VRSSRNFTAMQIKAGVVLLVALILLFAGLVIFPTRGVNPLTPKISLVAYSPFVSGLRASSPVWLSGVEVGTITQVKLVPGSDPLQVRVALRVQRWTLDYLSTESRAVIKGMGILGDMFIELTPSAKGQPLTDGSVIQGEAPQQAQDELKNALGTVQELMKSVNRIAAGIENGQGTLGQLIQDRQLYTQMVAVMQGLTTTLAALNTPGGTANRLLYDPALYQEMLASFQGIRTVVNDLKQAEKTLISPETRKTLEDTVETASALVNQAAELGEKIQKIRFELNFGVDKLESNLVAGHADVLIWPNDQRYYHAGVNQISRLYGVEEEETTFQGDLAWRILGSPFFIRGGIRRNEYFNLGLDLRSWDNNFRLLADVYRLEFDPLQLDMRAGYKFLEAVELSIGAEDILRRPFFKAGLTIFYVDPDLLNVFIRTRF